MAKIAYPSRQALAVNNNTFVGSGADFGAYGVTAFTRITGIASVIGSATIRLRTGFNPTGPFVTTSNWNVSSGPNIMDAPNYGSVLAVDVTGVASQAAYSFAIYGDPAR